MHVIGFFESMSGVTLAQVFYVWYDENIESYIQRLTGRHKSIAVEMRYTVQMMKNFLPGQHIKVKPQSQNANSLMSWHQHIQGLADKAAKECVKHLEIAAVKAIWCETKTSELSGQKRRMARGMSTTHYTSLVKRLKKVHSTIPSGSEACLDEYLI